jgi:hypothetical protein
MTPFHIRTRSLAHRREGLGFGLALAVRHGAQRAPGPAGRKQRGAQALGKRTQRRSGGHRPRRGHPIESIGGQERGVQGVRRGRRQVPLAHLLPHIARDEREGGVYVGHHTRSFRDPLQARRAEGGVLGHGADRLAVAPDSPGEALAVATHAARQSHTVLGGANGAHARGDGLALPGAALGLVASRLHLVRNLLQARCHLWGPPWPTLFWPARGVVEVLVHPRARRFSRRHGLGRSPLCDGQRRCDRLAPRMLPMEEVRRVLRPEVLFHRRQPAWGLIAGRLDPLTGAPRQGRRHQRRPGIVSPRLGRLL